MNVKRVMRAYGVRCRAISVAICGLYSGFSLSLAQANHTFDLGYLRSMLLLLVGFCLFSFVFLPLHAPMVHALRSVRCHPIRILKVF